MNLSLFQQCDNKQKFVKISKARFNPKNKKKMKQQTTNKLFLDVQCYVLHGKIMPDRFKYAR